MASNDYPSDVCPACLQSFQDARLLSCLHSVCKACIDKMAVTATDGVVTCPICQATERLPSTGASGLPIDVAVSRTEITESGSLGECGLCEDDKKKPVSWCKTCCVALCESHTLPHVLSAVPAEGHHVIVPISVATEKNIHKAKSVSSTGTPLCVHHGEALKYHCGTCDEAICGACTAIGHHRMHHEVRLIKDILNERKKQVTQKVETLERDVVRKLQRSLQAVDNVSTELERRADKVRTDIRQAGKRVVDMVEAHIEQMVQEVDDLELSRCKVLDSQRKELKSHLDAARNAVRFHDRIMQLGDSGEEPQFSLLRALETRTAALISTHIKEQPECHSRMTFKAASDTDLACKSKESLGKVVPCQASAKHSKIEGETTQTAMKGEITRITIRAKDSHGENMTCGGDVISSSFATSHAAENTPSTTTTDNGDGSYTISCTCQSAGTFQLEAYVNGEKMATVVTVKCVTFTSAFDPNECQKSITISDDGQKASFTGNSGNGHVSVLGSTPMRHGQHTWKVKIGTNPNYHMLGVATKPLSPQRKGDYHQAAFCWYSIAHAYYRDGVLVSGRLQAWSGSDTFQLILDCDLHTLQITNMRSGESSTFRNLPAKVYYQFATLLQKGNSVEFVE